MTLLSNGYRRQDRNTHANQEILNVCIGIWTSPVFIYLFYDDLRPQLLSFTCVRAHSYKQWVFIWLKPLQTIQIS
jgi:hypothetical protein